MMEKSPVTFAWSTLRPKNVLLCKPPVAIPVIVTLADPVALELAAKVTIDKHVGVQFDGANEAVTPDGSPEVLKVTSCPVPDSRVAAMVVLVVPPWATVPLVGEAERRKSNSACGTKWKLRSAVV